MDMNGKLGLGNRRPLPGVGVVAGRWRYARHAHVVRLVLFALAGGAFTFGCDTPVDVLEPKEDASVDASALDAGLEERDAGLDSGTVAMDAGTDARTGVEVPEAILAQTRPVARAHCEWMRSCGPGLFRSMFLYGFDHCVEVVGAVLGQTHVLGHTPPPSQWCLPTLDNDADCDELFECEIPPGTLREGDTCLSGLECGRTADDAPMQCFECRCARYPTEGELCAYDRCAADLVCAFAEAGDRCSAADFVADGEACDPEARVLCLEGSWCVDGTCVTRPRLGDSCDPEGAPCLVAMIDHPGGFACIEGDDGHRCGDPYADLVAAGDPCAAGDYCASGSQCPASGVCPTACGGPDRCGPSQACVDGVCVTARLECGAP